MVVARLTVRLTGWDLGWAAHGAVVEAAEEGIDQVRCTELPIAATQLLGEAVAMTTRAPFPTDEPRRCCEGGLRRAAKPGEPDRGPSTGTSDAV